MALEPYSWNVTIAGLWNRAILTPQGIASRLFHKPPETAIEIEFPIDALGPYKVTCDEIVVVCTSAYLLIEPKRPTYEALDRAKLVAREALVSLPETPLSAIGINIRYRGGETVDGISDAIADGLNAEFDAAGLPIVSQTVVKSMEWHGGRANVGIQYDDNDLITIEMNLEKRSTSRGDHEAWVQTSTADVEALVKKILTEVLVVSTEDIGNG